MHPYEEMIADEINMAANKEIFFKPDEIMKEPDNISAEIISKLVSFACQGQNILPITIARDCLKQFPADWVSERIKETAFNSIDITDEWEYRRLLELSKIISPELLRWAVSLGENSDAPDIAEAAEDFR